MVVFYIHSLGDENISPYFYNDKYGEKISPSRFVLFMFIGLLMFFMLVVLILFISGQLIVIKN